MKPARPSASPGRGCRPTPKPEAPTTAKPWPLAAAISAIGLLRRSSSTLWHASNASISSSRTCRSAFIDTMPASSAQTRTVVAASSTISSTNETPRCASRSTAVAVICEIVTRRSSTVRRRAARALARAATATFRCRGQAAFAPPVAGRTAPPQNGTTFAAARNVIAGRIACGPGPSTVVVERHAEREPLRRADGDAVLHGLRRVDARDRDEPFLRTEHDAVAGFGQQRVLAPHLVAVHVEQAQRTAGRGGRCGPERHRELEREHHAPRDVAV